jgi:hypothetical protein
VRCSVTHESDWTTSTTYSNHVVFVCPSTRSIPRRKPQDPLRGQGNPISFDSQLADKEVRRSSRCPWYGAMESCLWWNRQQVAVHQYVGAVMANFDVMLICASVIAKYFFPAGHVPHPHRLVNGMCAKLASSRKLDSSGAAFVRSEGCSIHAGADRLRKKFRSSSWNPGRVGNSM